jgi:hypothetical protein
MNTDWQCVKQILAETVARESPSERATYLESACGGDAELRAQVEQLLRAHVQAGLFLEEPALSVREPGVSLPALITEKIGDRIGPYKLHRLLNWPKESPSRP